MDSANPTIFRAEALQHQLRNTARRGTGVSLPRAMAAPVVVSLWLALGLLLVAGAASCFVRVDVPGSGLAIVTAIGARTEEGMTVTAIMPAKDGLRIHGGMDARVLLDGSDAAITGIVAGDASGPLDSPAVERALGLPVSSLAVLKGPMVIVRIDMEPAGAVVPGMTGRAEMQVGSRPVGSFLPLVGKVFRSDV